MYFYHYLHFAGKKTGSQSRRAPYPRVRQEVAGPGSDLKSNFCVHMLSIIKLFYLSVHQDSYLAIQTA